MKQSYPGAVPMNQDNNHYDKMRIDFNLLCEEIIVLCVCVCVSYVCEHFQGDCCDLYL